MTWSPRLMHLEIEESLKADPVGGKSMRYFCWICKKSVTSELPDDSVIRALLVCPECIETGKVTFCDLKITKKD